MNNERIYYSRDAEMQAMRKMTIITVFCLAAGVGIGTVLALLLAPDSGEKTRENLAQTVGEGINTGRESLEPVVKRLEEQFNELRKNVEARIKQN